MQIDPKEWRPIKFEGVIMPQSLMAITVLGEALPEIDDETDNWLWELAICCGRTKLGSARDCVRFSEVALNAVLSHKLRVQDHVRIHLQQNGFDPETTCAEWLSSLTEILHLSRASTTGQCSWSAPSHPDDLLGNKDGVDRFIRALDATANSLNQNKK